jgi:apolipoprotein N-acyltransferase
MKLWLLAVFSSLLQLLPFPFAGPMPPWGPPFAWVCLLPLLSCLHLKAKDGKPLEWWQFAALGWVNGTLWWAIHCYWVYQTFHLYGGISSAAGVLIQIILAGLLGINCAVFATTLLLLDRLFARRLWVMPLGAALVWVATELFRARVLGVPWDQLGMSQIDNPLLMHLPPWTGVYGVSFLIVLVNGMLAQIFASGKFNLWQRSGMVLAGIAIALAVQPWPNYSQLGIGPFRSNETASATAVLLQENLDVAGPREPITIDQMLQEFTHQSETPSTTVLNGIPGTPQARTVMTTTTPPSLIVWPESPAPFISSDPGLRHWMSALAGDANAALIVGSIGVDADPSTQRGYRMYNSANFVAANGEIVGRYDKIHLVPFGEYVPFQRELFFIKNLTEDAGDFDSGRQRNLFITGGHSYGVFICYEAAFADEVRRFAKEGADVLVTISDDGWYGDSGAPWQHLNLARMRAIENHRWLLRDTDTGITAAIDPNGIVREAAPRHLRTAVEVHFGYEQGTTFYTRHGDWFAYLCALGVVVMIAMGQQVRFADYLHLDRLRKFRRAE